MSLPLDLSSDCCDNWPVMMRRLLRSLVVCALALGTSAAAWAIGDIDLEPFFARLESASLDTATIRFLTSHVQIRFRDPGQGRQAEYDPATRTLYIPSDLRQPGGRGLREDLTRTDVATLVHEFQHAYDLILAQAGAPEGSDEREVWRARQQIRSDLGGPNDPSARESPKVLEIAGYYLGAAISDVLGAAELLVMFNETMTSSYIVAPGDAQRLGDRFVIPGRDSSEPLLARLHASSFGSVDMRATAYCAGRLVRWPQDRADTKLRIYDRALGLHPPISLQDLASRLNESANPRVVQIRERIAKARFLTESILPGATLRRVRNRERPRRRSRFF